MGWVKLPEQIVLPRSENGIDYSRERILLLARKMPDGTLRRLEWRPGGTSWSGVGSKTYYPATLTLSDTGDLTSRAGHTGGIDVLGGGRLSANRITRDIDAKIRKHLDVLDTAAPLPIDRSGTYLWADAAWHEALEPVERLVARYNLPRQRPKAKPGPRKAKPAGLTTKEVAEMIGRDIDTLMRTTAATPSGPVRAKVEQALATLREAYTLAVKATR